MSDTDMGEALEAHEPPTASPREPITPKTTADTEESYRAPLYPRKLAMARAIQPKYAPGFPYPRIPPESTRLGAPKPRYNIARHDCIHGQIGSLNSEPFITVSATTYNLLKKPEHDYSLSLIALEA